MRNKRLIIAIAAAVVFGLIAAVSVSRYLANAREYTKNLNNVVVAKVDIPIGTRIIAEQLAITQLPRSAAPDGTEQLDVAGAHGAEDVQQQHRYESQSEA